MQHCMKELAVSGKPDVLLADKKLRQLERDFCEDLLIDNRDALVWPDNNNINETVKEDLRNEKGEGPFSPHQTTTTVHLQIS